MPDQTDNARRSQTSVYLPPSGTRPTSGLRRHVLDQPNTGSSHSSFTRERRERLATTGWVSSRPISADGAQFNPVNSSVLHRNFPHDTDSSALSSSSSSSSYHSASSSNVKPNDPSLLSSFSSTTSSSSSSTNPASISNSAISSSEESASLESPWVFPERPQQAGSFQPVPAQRFGRQRPAAAAAAATTATAAGGSNDLQTVREGSDHHAVVAGDRSHGNRGGGDGRAEGAPMQSSGTNIGTTTPTVSDPLDSRHLASTNLRDGRSMLPPDDSILSTMTASTGSEWMSSEVEASDLSLTSTSAGGQTVVRFPPGMSSSAVSNGSFVPAVVSGPPPLSEASDFESSERMNPPSFLNDSDASIPSSVSAVSSSLSMTSSVSSSTHDSYQSMPVRHQAPDQQRQHQQPNNQQQRQQQLRQHQPLPSQHRQEPSNQEQAQAARLPGHQQPTASDTTASPQRSTGGYEHQPPRHGASSSSNQQQHPHQQQQQPERRQQQQHYDSRQPLEHDVPLSSAPESAVVPEQIRAAPIHLETGGYDVDLVEPLREAHRCPICNSPLRIPVQTSCGHRFCKPCIDPLISGVDNAKCPVDGDPVSRTFPDKCCEREVLALAVRCRNSLNGCDWRGQLKDLEGHLTTCRHSLVRCTNPGCTQTMLLSNRQQHLAEECQYRRVNCRHCQRPVPKAKMEDHISRDCKEVFVTCPNRCGAEIRRKDFDAHVQQVCPRVPQPCHYARYGCTVKGTREEIDRHRQEHQDEHLLMVTEHTSQLETRLATTTRDVRTYETEVAAFRQQLVATEKRLQAVQDAQQRERPLDVATVMDDPRFARMLDAYVQDRLAVSRADSERGLQRSIEGAEQRAVQALESSEVQKNQVKECVKTLGQMSLTAARSDAALAEVDLRLLAVETNSYNGTIIFKINNFMRRLEEARTGRRVSLYSPTFYTSRHGYKVCLRVYLNGDGSGKGSHVSVFFTIMKGEFDSLLDWPFRAKVTFTVMDQGPPRHNRVESFMPDQSSSSFQRPVNDMNIASGCPKMISHEDLFSKTGNYLRDDCLYIKAAVDPSICRLDI